MSFSEIFIGRPVATILLTLALALAGALAFVKLPVAPLPQVDFPTLAVNAQLPGASPETMATSVAEPLERHLGRIADLTEMTSRSALGQTQIVLQFSLERDIDGAARDVEAAINAARADLPSDLRSNPTYRKVNPANAPILILAMTSKTLTGAQLYDVTASVLQQRLSQLPGIGQLIIGGGSLPAVRVELNPTALDHYGLGMEDLRAALASANSDSPKGFVDEGPSRWEIHTNDRATRAADYRKLVVAWRNGAAVRLEDLGAVMDSVEDLRNIGLYNGHAAILAVLYRQPGANVIDTLDQVKAQLPVLRAQLPGDVHIDLVGDPSATIRASLHDTERTLMLAVLLVTGVVYLFLRDWRATLIPAVAVPVSIIGTFAAMYVLGYSLDNLSLMALTISTGFVVDDAIVVLENIARHLESGLSRTRAAIEGAREVGFTVLSISVSLVAVFIPLLLMGGIVGRLFREFALTLSIAILVSLVVSLTTTPMMCALLLRRRRQHPARRSRPGCLDRLLKLYMHSLDWAIGRIGLMLSLIGAAVLLNLLLFVLVPKGFFPAADTGRILGTLVADQSISFQLMSRRIAQVVEIIRSDPAIDSVVAFSGGGGGARAQTNSATVYAALKSRRGRSPIDAVATRLRARLACVPGASVMLNPVQDLSAGGRQTSAAYQYTLEGDGEALHEGSSRLLAALQKDPRLVDVSSDLQQGGLTTRLVIDRDSAARLGITPYQIDSMLYDAFGQRQVSVIHGEQSQYHVVMEVAPEQAQNLSALENLWVSTAGGLASGTLTTDAAPGTVSGGSDSAHDPQAQLARNAATNALTVAGHGLASAGAAVSTEQETMIPLRAVTQAGPRTTPLVVNHTGAQEAVTLSFNLAPGRSLSDALAAVGDARRSVRLPPSLHGNFSGTAQVFRQSLAQEPLLILAAIAAIYVVLGVLYESFVQPLTILSTLPSAGVGALLALRISGVELSIVALIGVILLVGIVTKNAIMMVDVALGACRGGLPARAAILEACRLRFRPILMTTLAALLGAVPLVVSAGEGSEVRRPLGIAIVGGLIVSQVLTLYTTPVIYLALERLGGWLRRPRQRAAPTGHDTGVC